MKLTKMFLPGGCRALRTQASEFPYPCQISNLHGLQFPKENKLSMTEPILGSRWRWRGGEVRMQNDVGLPSVHGSEQLLQSPV